MSATHAPWRISSLLPTSAACTRKSLDVATPIGAHARLALPSCPDTVFGPSMGGFEYVGGFALPAELAVHARLVAEQQI